MLYRTRTVAAVGLPALLLLAGHAAGEETILYADDFEESRPRPEWSANLDIETQGPEVFSRFAGRYGNEAITLTLDAPESPGSTGGPGGGDDGDGDDDEDDGSDGGPDGSDIEYRLRFDLYAIDSWDGASTPHGPDRFEVRYNGQAALSEVVPGASEGGPFSSPDVGPMHLGYRSSWRDRIYRDVAVPFELEPGAETIEFDFEGIGLQVLSDESWGLDNVRVTARAVPAPGSGALVAGGLFLAARRRRPRRSAPRPSERPVALSSIPRAGL